MKNIKKGMVLIYVLFLVTLSILFSTILLNNNVFLFNISQYFDVDSKLYSNIASDGKILVDINRELNTNGNGFVDNISCPISGISMSGNTLAGSFGTTLVNSGSIYCEGTYLTNPVILSFNSGFTDFAEADYNGFITSLTSGLGNSTFLDTDNTLIDFSSYNYNVSDGYDDDFNSDNYMVTATGNTSTGTYYLDDFSDDDNIGRKILFGYVSPDFGYKKVFWNTSKYMKIINNNSNNDDLLNIKIGDVTSGHLYFDVDKNFDLRIAEFDKGIYDETKELKLLSVFKTSIEAGIGYLQNNAGVLSLSSNITGNEYPFDFKNGNYATFIKATGTGTLLYKISGKSSTGTGMYIVPIDDSDPNIVSYLGSEILISDTGVYIAKETDIIYKK